MKSSHPFSNHRANIPDNKQPHLEELAKPQSAILATHNTAGERLNQQCLFTKKPITGWTNPGYAYETTTIFN